MSDTEKQEPKEIGTVGELLEALEDFPGDARLIVSCMDGTDRVYLSYEKDFNYVMVSG